jgi:ketosteroid isomerase-like protein
MSQGTVEIFRRGVEAANRSDTETFLELLHPEVEWHTVLPMVGGDAVHRGDIRDLGDRLIAIGRIRVTGQASGAPIDSPFAYVIEFRDGKVRLIRSYLDPKQALEAAGLPK